MPQFHGYNKVHFCFFHCIVNGRGFVLPYRIWKFAVWQESIKEYWLKENAKQLIWSCKTLTIIFSNAKFSYFTLQNKVELCSSNIF